MTFLEIVGPFALLALLGIGLATIINYARTRAHLSTPAQSAEYLKRLRKEVNIDDRKAK